MEESDKDEFEACLSLSVASDAQSEIRELARNCFDPAGPRWVIFQNHISPIHYFFLKPTQFSSERFRSIHLTSPQSPSPPFTSLALAPVDLVELEDVAIPTKPALESRLGLNSETSLSGQLRKEVAVDLDLKLHVDLPPSQRTTLSWRHIGYLLPRERAKVHYP